MAPIKFEEQIKDKLTQRTIQPSDVAWEQLSKKLDTEEKKTSRRLFFYVGIAASLVGILLMSKVMSNKVDDTSVIPTVVEAQKETSQDIAPNNEMNQLLEANEVLTTSDDNRSIETKNQVASQLLSSIKNEPKIDEVVKGPVSNKNVISGHLTSNENTSLMTEQAITIASVNEQKTSQDIVKPTNELTFEDVKALQVVAEIKKIEIEKGSVTDVEIENLLKQAEKEILKNRIFNETTRTVNAEELLQDVEEELEQSFRTKVFESLKSSYKTVKTAVAERIN